MATIGKIFILSLSCFIFLSCAHNRHETSVNKILPRNSFAFIKKTVIIRSCFKNICGQDKKIRSVGSGVAVANNSRGTYILTAGHLCHAPSAPKKLKDDFKIKNKMQIIDMDGTEYDAEIIDYKLDNELDICMLLAANADITPVKISNTMVSKGDKIYNLAAPLGVWASGVVPILEGRYIGLMYSDAIYSVPAAPGSSGSSLFNHRGELVGIIHSVYIRFHNLSLSIPQKKMIKFIKQTIENDLDNVDEDVEDYDEDEEGEDDDGEEPSMSLP